MNTLPISSDPEVMGGSPVFTGTRVLVQVLIDYLETGETIDLFLEDFPSVTREQVEQFLQLASSRLIAELNNP